MEWLFFQNTTILIEKVSRRTVLVRDAVILERNSISRSTIWGNALISGLRCLSEKYPHFVI
jgi:hypothetical protein